MTGAGAGTGACATDCIGCWVRLITAFGAMVLFADARLGDDFGPPSIADTTI